MKRLHFPRIMTMWCTVMGTVFLAWGGSAGELHAAAAADTTQVASVNPDDGKTLTLRFWAPPGVSKLRGVVVCGPGLNKQSSEDFLAYAEKPEWRIMAQRHAFAVVGLQWTSGYSNGNPNYYGDDRDIQALEKGLKAVGDAAGHPELDVVPIAIWGMSASSGYAVHFADARPARCIAFAHNKGSSVGSFDLTGNALTIPGLLCYGTRDTDKIDTIEFSFDWFRSNGALVGLTIDWGMGHSPGGYGRNFAIVFFDQVIEMRLPENYRPGTVASLIPLQEADGWLGKNYHSSAANPNMVEIIKRSDFTGSNADALTYSWFPNQYLARVWQAAVTQTKAAAISSPGESNAPDAFLPTSSFVSPGTPIGITARAINNFSITSMSWYDGNVSLGQPVNGSLTTSVSPSYGLHPILATVTTQSGITSTSGFSLIYGTRGTPTAPTFTTAATITPDVLKPGDTAALNVLAKTTDGGLDRLITYTWSVASGPDTATFSSSNGSHQGNSLTVSFPTSGTYTLQVVASNAEGKNSIAQITANVTDTGKLSPNIITQPGTTAKLGTTYSYGFHATGKPAPTYTLVTAPTGMTIDSASGLISWAPDSVGTFAITAQASNGEAPDATQSFSITVSGVAPTITSSPITQSVINGSYRYRVIATGLPAPTYQLTQAPTGMSIDSSGLISWTPDGMGEFFVAVAVTNDAGSVSQSFNVNVQAPPTITSTPVTTATVGTEYTSQTYATGYPTPTYSLVTAPTGMKIDSATGAITWTPTANGFYTVTLQASNGTTPATQSFVIAVNGGASTTDNGVTTTSTTSSANNSGGGGGGCGLGSGAAAALLGLSLLLMKRLRSRQA